MKLPFYVFWPYKNVPEWLEKVTTKGATLDVPVVQHRGFGLVLNIGGEYHVFTLLGIFLYIYAPGLRVYIKGGGKGIVFRRGRHLFTVLFNILRGTR